MKRILIIPSAGRARRLSPLNNYFPKALIPCGDKPALSRILDFYKHIAIQQVVIVVASDHVARFRKIVEHYRYRFPIKIIVQKSALGLLDSIVQAKEEIAKADQVLIHLADTLLQMPLHESDLQQSWVLSAKVINPRDWCMIKFTDKQLLSLVDKPVSCEGKDAICGVYFFHRIHILLQALKYAMSYSKPIHGELQVSGLIERYKTSQPVLVRPRNDWSDIGNLKRLHAHTTFDARGQNKLIRRGQSIVKKSSGKLLVGERFYYRNLKVPQYFPKIFEIDEGKITMSYEPLQSLAYLFLYESMEEENTQYVVDELWSKMIQDFYGKCTDDALSTETAWMYGKRIVDRVEELSEKAAFPLQFVDTLYINNVKVIGWPKLKSIVLSRARDLADTAIIRHIHGDFHCANILYDALRHIFIFVDPRGEWGRQVSVYGDIRYDFGKFLHSFHGGYEFIKNNLSFFECYDTQRYTLKMPSDPMNTLYFLQPYLDNMGIKTKDVLWIEALCFLSMGKFYSDYQMRQQFFLRGLYLLNQLL
ncbi:MAG: hypothetical protein A2V81_03745 [Candidatus Abawacabacteria bacterium RBG_16_42_10]|uniref:glucose-1-phosphate thymidylyltransferase n=1 Tax=Candidatus Abawacabacteria bacterium RBG_16_42_10 TaxID=1817814 RepID=A0A1F4XK20_9BACT|nr:MAG: hypothetical protein A2V81_03745 [Candidatus Abawacabacteria bacterium RBG_16_42_10]